MTDTRPVWLDDDLCGFIYTALAMAYPKDIEGKADVFHRAWKAAPADATEAIARALFRVMQMRYPGVTIADPEATMNAFRAEASHIATALGMPDA